MAEGDPYLAVVGAVCKEVTNLGLTPILVGGMALVMLGSRRVTRDFDFVIASPDDRLEALIAVFYSRGLELASRLNDDGDVVATIDNRRVAAARLKVDAPSSASFFNPQTTLRIDLLFDFPISASELAKHARRVTVQSQVLRMASEKDLLRLTRIARDRRSAPGDAQDIAFLEARRKRSR